MSWLIERAGPPPAGVWARLASPTAATRATPTIAPTRIRRDPFPPPMAESYGALRLGESLSRAPRADDQRGRSGEQEGRCEARQRRREIDGGRVGVRDPTFPPSGPLGGQPLVEAEADEPGEDHLRPHCRALEHLLSC